MFCQAPHLCIRKMAPQIDQEKRILVLIQEMKKHRKKTDQLPRSLCIPLILIMVIDIFDKLLPIQLVSIPKE